MLGISGKIIETASELDKIARTKKKKFVELSVSPLEAKIKEQDGWRIIRKGKTSFRIRKMKPYSEAFEDRVWLLFYKLGFHKLNLDNNCKVGGKKIDVLANDSENTFVIECKSSINEETISARQPLTEYRGLKKDIDKVIKREWGKESGRISVVIITSSQGKSDSDLDRAKELEKDNIFLWSSKEVHYIESLISQVGNAAKYQIYSVLFGKKSRKSLKIKYPVIKGKIADKEIYSFLIPAKELIKYAYVHHRELDKISQASEVYQRMLQRKKLQEIKKFIDNEGGYFPNSIIVNFSEKLDWNLKESFDKMSLGTITLPDKYGSAWIIDGQHRVYGAANATTEVLLPVLAFEGISTKEQANLFVEINEKQTSVSPKLLWDLYSDLYRDSSDPRQLKLFHIAETAKCMEANGPFANHIDIMSIPKDRSPKLSLATICSTIDKFLPWDALTKKVKQDDIPAHLSRLINLYFQSLKDLWPVEWILEKGNLLLSNNGYGVLIMLFNDVINHLVYMNKENLLFKNRHRELISLLKESYLCHIVEYFEVNPKEISKISKLAGRGPQSEAVKNLDIAIQIYNPSFNPPRIIDESSMSITSESINDDPESKIKIVEGIFRDFIFEELIRHVDQDKWWKRSIPEVLKKKADERWSKEIMRKAFKRDQTKSDHDYNKDKFEYFGLGELYEIIIYGHNWNDIFKNFFQDKNQLNRRLLDIAALRNALSHQRTIDDQDRIDGFGGLSWLSKCLNKPELNPLRITS